MKKQILLFLAILDLSIVHVSAQEKFCSQLKVGQPAPDFKAQAAVGEKTVDVSLTGFGEVYKVIVFYPADFSIICPTELRALQEKLDKFKEKNTQVLAISVDSIEKHHKWLKTPIDKGGIEGVTYPLVSDSTKEISKKYGVLDEQEGVALRGVFIVDPDNIVQAAQINNLSAGRDIAEILRLLSAIQHIQEFGEGCPANWHEGDQGIAMTQEGLEEYLQKEQEK